jgi:hypothetical protein
MIRRFFGMTGRRESPKNPLQSSGQPEFPEMPAIAPDDKSLRALKTSDAGDFAR